MGAAINAATIKITAVITVVQTFSRVMGTAFERQNAEQRLKNLTGSTEEYQAALQQVSLVSQNLASRKPKQQKHGDVYSRLSGVGFGLKEVTTFTGFNVVARESGISSEAAFCLLTTSARALVYSGRELRPFLSDAGAGALCQEMAPFPSQAVWSFQWQDHSKSFFSITKASEGR